MTAELHWFPFFVKDWLSSPARMAMLPEQRGAYFDLLAIAWGNGEQEPFLPNDDATLSALSGLGRRWRKLGPLVRAQFTDRDGCLYNAKLSSVWFKQHDKHERAVQRAAAGGRAKARHKSATSSQQAVPQECLQGAEPEPDTETTEKHSAPDGAPPASWTARIAAVWSGAVGPISAGRIGKALKPLVDKHGEERVARAMRAYIAVRKGEGKTCNLKWFADEGEVWLGRTTEPMGVVGGEMSATLELLTRPAAKAS